MIFKDVSLNSPEENIFFDEVLLKAAENGISREVIRFWESKKTFIVLGRLSKAVDDIFIEKAGKDGIPIIRRGSGGGTVLQGRGCLNYSLILDKAKHPETRDLHNSYSYILGKITGVLGERVFYVSHLPVSDMVLMPDKKKFSGNAQRRRKKYILHHGTILYDFDLDCIEKYLKIPENQPEYRRNRSHLDFLTNIKLSKQEIEGCLLKAFLTDEKDDSLSAYEEDTLKDMITLTRNA